MPAALPSESLCDRFWALADGECDPSPAAVVAVVRQFIDVLTDVCSGSEKRRGSELSQASATLLALLRRREVEGDLTYASPEQARGETVDERSVVFSVGVLLFHRLTGRHPFGSDQNPQRITRIKRGEMMSGVNYFPQIPGELRAIVARASAAFPEERWHNTRELKDRLEEFV